MFEYFVNIREKILNILRALFAVEQITTTATVIVMMTKTKIDM